MLATVPGVGARKPAAPVAVADVVINGRKLSRQQAVDLERAAQMASGSLEARRQAATLVARVTAELAASAEAEDVAQVAVRLQRAPGGDDITVETVERAAFVRDARGRVALHQGEPVLKVEVARRVRRVDGLASLLERGAISPAQYDVMMMYRAALDRAQPHLSSALAGERLGQSRQDDDDAQVKRALARGVEAVRLRLVRQAVGDDQAFTVLHAVAGEGKSLRSISGGGRSTVLDKALLLAAVDKAEPWLRLPCGKLEAALKNRLANRER